MKRFLAICLTFLLTLTVFGCAPIGTANREKLAQIPREGNYIFFQGNSGVTDNGEFISVESKAREVIKNEGKKLYNLNSCDFYYVLSDDGKFMWFLVQYSSKGNEDNYKYGEFEYAIGSTPLPNVDVKIEYYLPTLEYYFNPLLEKVGNYFICRGEKDLFAIDLTTFEMSTIEMGGYSFKAALSNSELFTLGCKADGKTYYRIFDEKLNEYNVAFEEEWNYTRIKDEYIFHFVERFEEEQCRCINYKTGEKFDQERSYALYESFFAAEKEKADLPYSTFEYNGKTYAWESLTYSVETPAKDESGNDITQTRYWEKLSFEDLETGEEYELIPTELTGDCATAMQQILDIYGACEWKQVLVQDGELFFVMVNETSFFGAATPKTSPRIVFKYNEAEGNLDYVGYAMYTYYDIIQIYNGAKS